MNTINLRFWNKVLLFSNQKQYRYLIFVLDGFLYFLYYEMYLYLKTKLSTYFY